MTAFAFYGILTSGLSEALGSYGGRCLIRGDLYDVGAFPAVVAGVWLYGALKTVWRRRRELFR